MCRLHLPCRICFDASGLQRKGQNNKCRLNWRVAGGGEGVVGLIFGQARAKNNNEFIQSDGAKEESSVEPLPMKMLMGLSPSPPPPSHNNPETISHLVS